MKGIDFDFVFSEYYLKFSQSQTDLFLLSTATTDIDTWKSKITRTVQMINPSILRCQAICYFNFKGDCQIVVYIAPNCYIGNYATNNPPANSIQDNGTQYIYLNFGGFKTLIFLIE